MGSFYKVCVSIHVPGPWLWYVVIQFDLLSFSFSLHFMRWFIGIPFRHMCLSCFSTMTLVFLPTCLVVSCFWGEWSCGTSKGFNSQFSLSDVFSEYTNVYTRIQFLYSNMLVLHFWHFHLPSGSDQVIQIVEILEFRDEKRVSEISVWSSMMIPEGWPVRWYDSKFWV